MSCHPRDAPNERLECPDCHAPVVKTSGEEFVCIDCGDSPTA